MNEELSDLKSRYPLSASWETPAVFSESVSVGPLTIELFGLSTRHSSGKEALGSAAELSSRPVARAYFELLERTAIIEALAEPRAEYELFDFRRHGVGRTTRSRVFPEAPDPARQRYSLSNGVAAHTSWSRACQSAAYELVERDRVLRAWYGQLPVTRTALQSDSVATSLADSYDFQLYSLGCCDFDFFSEGPKNICVAAVFGFPTESASPLLAGFGAAGEAEEAERRAWRECTQRLGFLWGEQIPSTEPELNPTPDYHQEFYLFPEKHALLEDWLAGAHRQFGSRLLGDSAMQNDVRFVDLTPAPLEGKMCVVKAMSESALELVFGRGHPALLCEPPSSLQVHPVA